MVRSPDYFWLDGVSSQTVGIWTDTPIMPAYGQRKYIQYDVSDESDGYADDYREDVEYTLTCYTFERDFDPRAVYAFLDGKKRLVESIRPNIEYRIKKVLGVVPEYEGKGKTTLKIGFVMSPYKYSVNNPEVAVRSGGTIDCEGSVFAKPIIKFKATGTVNIITNGQSFKIYDLPADTQVTIDSQKQIVYDQNGNILLNKTEGYLPLLAVTNGEQSNIITWSGNLSGMKIIKNERWV